MLVPDEALEELAAALPGDQTTLRVVSVCADIDPLDLVRATSAPFPTAVYFGKRGSSELGGLGVAYRTVATFGEARLAELAGCLGGIAGLPPDTRIMVGFSFDPGGPHRSEWDGFPATAALLPLVSVVRGGGGGRLTLALPPGLRAGPVFDLLKGLETPGEPVGVKAADHTIESRPTPAEWTETVREAVHAIRAGTLDKVVLARSVLVRSDVAPAPFDLVERLRTAYPGCFAFGWQEGGSVFLGASPELMLARAGDRIRSQPLAGSAPRGEGEDEDRAYGEALMASSKDRVEHAVVVDDIVERLRPVSREIRSHPTPALLKLANVQHLATNITGTLSQPRPVLELAGELHPTPAVGGTPRPEALAFIRKAELVDRGWYSGGIGWVDTEGDGEIALALRCGLVRGTTAHLYAGAGIVADSNPDEELEETRLKFRPLLNLLTEA